MLYLLLKLMVLPPSTVGLSSNCVFCEKWDAEMTLGLLLSCGGGVWTYLAVPALPWLPSGPEAAVRAPEAPGHPRRLSLPWLRECRVHRLCLGSRYHLGERGNHYDVSLCWNTLWLLFRNVLFLVFVCVCGCVYTFRSWESRSSRASRCSRRSWGSNGTHVSFSTCSQSHRRDKFNIIDWLKGQESGL